MAHIAWLMDLCADVLQISKCKHIFFFFFKVLFVDFGCVRLQEGLINHQPHPSCLARLHELCI